MFHPTASSLAAFQKAYHAATSAWATSGALAVVAGPVQRLARGTSVLSYQCS